jgi:hypothetical protein
MQSTTFAVTIRSSRLTTEFTDLKLLNNRDKAEWSNKVTFSRWIIKHHAMKTWGSEGTVPPFLTSALHGGWMVGFTPRPLCRQGKSSQYPVGGPQSWYWRYGAEKSFLSLPTIEPRPSSQPLYSTSYPGSIVQYKTIFTENSNQTLCICQSCLI